MKDSELRLRSELKILKAMVPLSCRESISLIETVLASKMPEKSDQGDNELARGWNLAIDAHRLSRRVSEEEIFEIIKNGTINWGGAVPSEYWGYEKAIARAIASYVNGEEK